MQATMVTARHFSVAVHLMIPPVKDFRRSLYAGRISCHRALLMGFDMSLFLLQAGNAPATVQSGIRAAKGGCIACWEQGQAH